MLMCGGTNKKRSVVPLPFNFICRLLQIDYCFLSHRGFFVLSLHLRYKGIYVGYKRRSRETEDIDQGSLTSTHWNHHISQSMLKATSTSSIMSKTRSSQEKNIMRTHVVALAFDGEEVWLNSTSFESFNTMVLHPNQLISDDQNGNILVWDLIANSHFKMEDGVIHVYASEKDSVDLFPIASSATTFFIDMHHILKIISVGNLEREFFTEYGEAGRYEVQDVVGKGSYGVVGSATD
ncbi:unnamed protein product [Lactuca saligna]|uniref:Protein kinase domain-containing protein n=1 Tax=Lactuca saligna TaxID=75948 RepID=A0AA35Y8S8_LACSI|nr:unnamed protein product [Lactuca saligna]